MSPSEFQLRDALHDGEGDPVDADAVIWRAQRQRRDQRARLLSGAAAGKNDAASGPSGVEVTGSRKGPGGNASSPLGQLKCPDFPPTLKLPGAIRPVGSADALFPESPAAVKVCAYPVASLPARGSLNLYGTDASALVASLEAASPLPPHESCSTQTIVGSGKLVIMPVTASGGQLTQVVVQLGCNDQASNGTAVRYGWTPSGQVASFLQGLPGSGPIKDGSPAN